jgi:hypothetical protein
MKSRLQTNPRSVIVLLLTALTASLNVPWVAAAPASPSAQDPASCLELVRATVANEVAANNDSSMKHMFRADKQTAQGSQTRLYVETREAIAGMTIAYNNKRLTPQDMAGEENRLTGLAGNAEQLKRKHSQEQENADRTLRIVKALPDAFLYQYDGQEPADGGESDVPWVRLRFRPNPAYQPPTHAEQVLVGMQGFLVIDPVARRIAKIDGTLFKEVEFGWGLLGHLDKGGHFLVEQRDVGNDCWEVSHMSLNFAGKILMFKTISIKSDEVFSDFQRVPNDTTFAQGVQMLKAEEAKLAQNRVAETIKSENKLH